MGGPPSSLMSGNVGGCGCTLLLSERRAKKKSVRGVLSLLLYARKEPYGLLLRPIVMHCEEESKQALPLIVVVHQGKEQREACDVALCVGERGWEGYC